MAIKIKKQLGVGFLKSAGMAYFMEANRQIPEIIEKHVCLAFKDKKEDDIIDLTDFDGDDFIEKCRNETIDFFKELKN